MMRVQNWIFASPFLWTLASTQRIREGCFDRYPMSCDATGKASDATTSAEDVCTRLSLEVFPSEDILMDPLQHAEYLNGLDADDDFCLFVQQVYHRCIFCGDQDLIDDCLLTTGWVQCGDQPPKQEILSSDRYPLFQTEADIDRTCAQLEVAAEVEEFLKDTGLGAPSTIDLCEKQLQMKHLCVGQCTGGCFDGPTGRAPTCEPYPGPAVNMSEPAWSICDTLDYDYLFWMDFNDILNISNHQDYLKAIPGNTTECEEAQSSYSECYWCASDRCFNDEHPVSCDVPDNFDDSIDAHAICEVLYSPIHSKLEDGSRDFYNTSLHAGALYFGANDSFCDMSQQVYHQCLWCHQTEYVEDFCSIGSWCESTATIPDDFVLPLGFEALNLSAPDGLDCEQIYDLWEETWEDPYTLPGCYRDIWVHRQCPEQFCNFSPNELNGEYLGASTVKQKRTIVWMSRVAAFLSFAGAFYIIIATLSDTKKHSLVYYRLLFAMAVFDVVTAAAWVFATLPIDKEAASHVHGANGTEAMCKTQAFFVQLGFTSIFYNVSLAIYYLLVVAYNKKEFQLKRIEWYLHGFPLFTGLALSLGAIPRYHWIEYGCHLLPPPDGDLWPVLVFVVCPLGISIVSITASMIVVYSKVRKQAAAAKKWQLSGGHFKSLESEVFWQCLFYVLAFYITWPILFSVYLASVDLNGPYGLALTVAFVAPLQGFSNFLVFVRPKVKQFFVAHSSQFTAFSAPLSTLFFKKPALGSGGNNPHASTMTGRNNDSPSPNRLPVIESDHSYPGNFVVHLPDGNTQTIEQVNDMDPSALLPIRTRDSESDHTQQDPSTYDESVHA